MKHVPEIHEDQLLVIAEAVRAELLRTNGNVDAARTLKDEMINAHLQGPTLDGDDDIGADDTCEDAEEEQVEVDQEVEE